MEGRRNKGDPGLLPPHSRKYGQKSVQNEHGEEVANGGDAYAGDNVMPDRIFHITGDD